MKTNYLLLAMLLVVTLLIGCAAPQTSSPEEPSSPSEPENPPSAAEVPEEAEVVEVPEEPEESTVLWIVAPQYMIDEGLEGTIRSAIENSDMANRVDFKLEGYQSIPPGIRTMCIGPEIPYLFTDSPVEEVYPDLMLVDSQSIYQFEPTLVSEVPGDFWEANGLTHSAQLAYTDMNGRLVGLAQGTRPVMMIYNRGSFGEHPVVQGLASGGQPILQWEEMNAIIDSLGENVLSVPPFAALIAAGIQGMGKNPEDIFENPHLLLDLAEGEYGSQIETIFGVENVGSFDPDQIQPFENPYAAFAVVDSGYLGRLANSDQQVDVLPIPAIAPDQSATSTQMLGWVVPEEAKYPEQSWGLASVLVNDPNMNQFDLRFGFLPTTDAGIESLGEWTDGNLLTPGNLQTLKDLARHSVAWHIPARFRKAECRQMFNEFMMSSDEIVAQLADKSLNSIDAAAAVVNWLDSLQSCSP